jgi:hypothetical protein
MSGYEHFVGPFESSSNLDYYRQYAEALDRWLNHARERVERLGELIVPWFDVNADGNKVQLLDIDSWKYHESALGELRHEFAALSSRFRIDPALSENDRQSLVDFMNTIHNASRKATYGQNSIDFDAVQRAFRSIEFIHDHIIKSIIKRIEGKPEPESDAPVLVTLNQAAGMVHKTKRALEHYKTKGTLPPPAVEGGGGKADYYDWKIIRPWLESTFGVKLSARFPASRRT